MIATTQTYKDAIHADTELTMVKASLNFFPAQAAAGAVITGSERTYSKINQLKQNMLNPVKYATTEADRWVLDGTFDFIDPTVDTQEVGYMSVAMSGSGKAFSSAPTITYTMDAPYNIIGVDVEFDDVEYATAYTISLYDIDDTLLATETVTNTDTEHFTEMVYADVKKIVLTISNWSEAGRFAKVTKLICGRVMVFDDTSIFTFDYLEVATPMEAAITYPTFSVSVDNSDRRFDVINPQGYMSALRTQMSMSASFGIRNELGFFEWLPLGKLFISDWSSEGQSDVVTFSALPQIAFSRAGYPHQVDNLTQTVSQAAEALFEAAGISEWSVDPSLASISVNYTIGYPNVPLADAMGWIAIAAIGYWRFGRDGSYQLLPLPADAVASVDYNNMWGKAQITQRRTKYTKIVVIYYPWDEQTDGLKQTKLTVSIGTDGEQADDIESRFIYDADHAKSVGEAALAWLNRQLDFSINYRGDPSIEAGDLIEVETDYGNTEVMVTSHEITWGEDKLQGQIGGVGSGS